MHKSIKSFELAQFPVLKAAIRQVPSDDKGNSFFAKLLLCDGKWVPVHEGIAISS